MHPNIAKTLSTYKQIYQSYKDSNVLPPEVEEQLNKFIEFVNKGKVLDIGCANGKESGYLHERGLEVIGIDITPEFIETAKEDYPEMDFRVMNMMELEFPDEEFSGVWGSASFLHIPKRLAQKTLTGFARVLKPDGILYLSVMEGDHDTLRPNPVKKWPDRHFSDYRSEEMESLLKTSGFQVLETESFHTRSGRVFLHFFVKKV